MAIKPILFNTEMVRAILDGRKTCTRRVIKPQWEECPHCRYVHNEFLYDEFEKVIYCARCGYPLDEDRKVPCQEEDILYVRETWHRYTKRVGKGEGCHLEERYGYKASIANSEDAEEPWKPSIHMPKEAARIWLKVTDVRVERLHEITEVQAQAEGCNSGLLTGACTARGQFEDLWNTTIKKSDIDRYGWNANPYVWVIEFERCEKPQEV